MTIGDLYERMGTTAFPIDDEALTDSFAPLDGARDRLLDLFATAINAEFGAAWAKIAATLPAGHKLRGTDPVQDRLALQPNPATILQRKTAFPLLAIHRFGTVENEQFLMHTAQRKCQWQLHYVLGPFDIEGQRKLGDICTALFGLVYSVIRQRGHKAFDGGALQFFPGKGNLSSVRLVNQEGPGQATFAGDESGTLYWCTTFTLETTEPAYDDLDGLSEFDAVDQDADLGNSTTIAGSSDVPVQYG